jgi:hypothetical protein
MGTHKACAHDRKNPLLRELHSRLCCPHGLAAVGFTGGGGDNRGALVAWPVSARQIQFCAPHTLRVFGWQPTVVAKFHRFPRAQGRAFARTGEDEIGNVRLRTRPNWDTFHLTWP